ncbi:Sodium-independent sulfate anion transporter, partial [Armadillidium nasatum]
MKTLKKKLPCLNWIPEYDLSCLVGDSIAGLTVSLLIIPQALAYGLVAGLPPNYGLYSAFVGGIIYFFFGSTNELNIGPTAIMSLMTYQYTSHGGADYAVLLCFLTGVIELIAAIVNLGKVEAGIPSPELPPFSITINNQTMSFEETIKDIGLGVIMVPLIGILNDVAVVSSFSKGNGFDITQEITVLGLINIIGSFFRSMPTTACFSRTAVNATSGVRTPAAGLLTGISVLIALAVLTPFFRYIPKASLAAVIICAVLQMIDYGIVKPLWKTKKLELLHLIVTFVACLFIGLEWGILLGITVNLVCMLFKLATPTVSVDHANFPQSNYPFVLVTPSNGMLYPSSMHIRTVILKAGMKEGNGILPVVVDCSHIVDFDYTSLKGLIGMMDSFKKSEQPLIFLNMKPTIISRVKLIKDEITSYDSLEQVENKL